MNQGGDGGNNGGGGGGGGLYGGGGGQGDDDGAAGGGGGSGLGTTLTAGSGVSAGNNSDTDYAGAAGQGGAAGAATDGAGGNGNPGRIVLIPSGVTFRASANAGITALGNLTISKPAGTVQNDVMIGTIGFRTNAPGIDSRDVGISAPSGWTLVRRLDNNQNSTGSGLAIYRLTAGASEPASYAWGFSCINVSGSNTCVANGFNAAVGGIVTFSGVDPANPIDVENGVSTPSSTSTLDTPSVTTTVANTMLVTAHAIPNANTFANPPTSGMTQAFQRTTSAEMIQVSYALQAAAGATGTKRATDLGPDTADLGNAHILALRPAAVAATLSSAASQSFTVGQAAATASTLTVTDSATPTITTLNDIRIRIPAGVNMIWDTSVTTFTAGGGASGKVAATGVYYEDSNKTAVINVTTSFAASDVLTIAGLKFANFTAVSAADNLELVTAGAGGATAGEDDKTITIGAAVIGYRGAGTVASAANGNITPGLPSGWQPGDFHLAIIEQNKASGTITPVTMPTGWTLINAANHDTGSNRYRAALYYRIAQAGDTAPTITNVDDTIIARIIGFTNVDPVTPLDVTPSFTVSPDPGDMNVNAAAISTVTANTMLVFTAHIGDDSSTLGTPGAPTGSSPWTQSFYSDVPISGGDDLGIAAWYGARSATGNQPAVQSAWTLDTATSVGGQIALRPSTGGGGAAAWLSSAASQSFTVGQASTTAGTLTVTDGSPAVITAAQDLRIRIPSGFNMTWDTSVTSFTAGGGAAGKVSTTGVTYEDSGRTAVINVTTSFAASDVLTIAGLKFTNFTATSAANNLQLVVAGAGGATVATDDKTITITTAAQCPGSIAFDSSSSGGGNSASSLTWSHTTGSGANRLLVVGVSIRQLASDYNVSSITYNGVALTAIGTGAAYSTIVRSRLYYLVNPPTGTYNIVVTLTGSTFLAAGAASFSGVDQANPIEAFNGNTGGGTGSPPATSTPNVSVTTLTNNAWVVDNLVYRRFSYPGGPTATPTGAGQTDRWAAYGEYNNDGANVRSRGSTIGPKTPAGSTTMSWTLSDISQDWAVFAAAIKPAGAGATVSSAASQMFAVGQAAATASTLTVSDCSPATITAAQDLRIRIPSGFNMTWDTSVTSFTAGGSASTKVNTTGVTYEDSGRTAVINVTSNFAASDVLTIAGLKFANFTATSAASNLQLVVAGAGGATVGTDDKTITIVPTTAASLSSAANQSFTVGQASTAASTVTVTDGFPAVITAAQDIRIRIPGALSMFWDTTVTAVSLGGGAAGKVSATVSYEDSGKTVVLNVTTNFAGADVLTIAGLKFMGFAAVSPASNLELVVAGAGGPAVATDDKTIAIVAAGALTLSSTANQTFAVGQVSTAAIQMTVTDGPTPAITASQDLRIRIPAGLNMVWDSSVTTVTLGGGAAGKVSTSGVTYEASNKTVVLNVTSNFAAGDQVTIDGLKFTSFTAVSAASRLQLVVAGAGGATAATDDKTIAIISVVLLSSAANQTFIVGQGATTASTLTVTDSSTPTITDANNLRIRIPAALNMTWDTSVTSVTLGGSAAGKASTSVNYEDSDKTVRISVNTDFAAGDVLTIAGLRFTNFTATSAGNLQLVVAGSGGATAAIDDKTVTINGAGVTNQQTVAGCVAPGGTITYRAAAQAGAASGNLTLTINKPSGTAQNDVMIASIGVRPNTATITPPSGWTLVRRINSTAGTSNSLAVYWKLAGASEPANYSWTFSSSTGSAGGILAFSGVDTASPIDVENGQPTPDGLSHAAPSVTTTVANAMLVTSHTFSSAAAWTPPAGMAEVVDVQGGGQSTEVNYVVQAAAGATGTKTATAASDDDGGNAHILALRPAPSAPTSLVLPSWTPQSGELLLVGVALRDETVVPTVTGNGLTWTQVADRDNDRGQMGVNLFRASGASPSAGSITIDLPGNTLPVYAVAVRLSNVDTAVNQGVEAIATASGPSGSDNNDMKVSVTTVTAFATALAWGGQQGSATFTPATGEAIINQSSADCGASPDQMRGHMWQEVVPTPGSTQLGQDNDLSSNRPWAAIAVSIKPVTPTPPQPPGRFNAFETSTAAGALTGVIRTKLAGGAVSLDIIALNSTRTAVDTTFTGTVRVQAMNAADNSGALDGNGCRSSWTVIDFGDVTFVSGDNGRKTISGFNLANSYRDVRVRISYPTSSPTLIGCSNDNFAIRPSTLAGFAVTDGGLWDSAGTTRTLNDLTITAPPTGKVHKAGRPMSVRASAVNASGTTATSNYTGAPAIWLSACAGAACTSSFGTLTLTTTFAAGQLSSNTASYSDVGAFALQLVDSTYANVDVNDTVGDCGASGSYVCSATIDVGRFVPDHFTVSLNTPTFGTACGAFTYVGQKFSYTTAPRITVTARNFAGNTTTRYAGNWWRITNASLTGKSYTAAAGTLDTSGLPGTDPVIDSSTPGSGVGRLDFGSGTGLFFTRTTPVAPFNAEVSLAINVIDADGVVYASNPARFGQPTAGNGIAFNSGKPMRFGRFAIGNAYGSQLVPLLVRVEAQYWSGSPTNAFITNTLDSCTAVAPANYAMSNFTGNLSGSPTCETAISGGGTLSAGRGTLILATPGAGNDGSVMLTANLGATASGTTCTTLGGAPVSATTANLPHLQGNWGGGAYNVNPSARASFGIFRGSDEVIYMRENF